MCKCIDALNKSINNLRADLKSIDRDISVCRNEIEKLTKLRERTFGASLEVEAILREIENEKKGKEQVNDK